jgi:opacity protein-like surface antigen
MLIAMIATTTQIGFANQAEELGTAIDLSAFSQEKEASWLSSDSLLSDSLLAKAQPADDASSVLPVALFDEAAPRQFYVSGILAASFDTLFYGEPPAIQQTAFSAGGALGVALNRPNGLLRFELEGRGRDNISETLALNAANYTTLSVSDGWSAMANMWRDLFFTKNFGAYAGGGIGGGGYRSTYSGALPIAGYPAINGSSHTSSFAWQAGCGVVYAVNSRLTLDLGYRFYALEPTQTDIYSSGSAASPPVLVGSGENTFSASELLLSIRIYEPFRGLMR